MTAERPPRDDLTPAGLEHARVIEARLAELEIELTRLRAQWNGTATEAYQSAQEQWRAALHDLNELLAPREDAPPPPTREAPAPDPDAPRRPSPRWA